jgi:nucleoside-diphosphate-sugar epimerase
MGYSEVEAAVRHFVLHESLEKVKACLPPVLSRVGLRQMTERVVPGTWVKQFEKRGRIGIPLPLKGAVVTGASGYLGHAILQTRLEQALVEKVVAPVRDPARAEAIWAGHPRKGCVRFLPWRGETVPPGLEAAELVIHAAAVRPPCAERPGDLFEENLTLTHAVVQGVRRYHTPLLIYISSQSVYAQRQPPPWDEETPLAPDSPYGYSKAAGEVAVQSLDGSPTRWAILRSHAYSTVTRF